MPATPEEIADCMARTGLSEGDAKFHLGLESGEIPASGDVILRNPDGSIDDSPPPSSDFTPRRTA